MPLPCPIKTIDSNFSGLRIAEELCPGELDIAANQYWFVRDPNSYATVGGTNKLVARETINKSRQDKKGSVVDREAAVGFSEDFTQTNMIRLLQGFFFNDADEHYNLRPIKGATNLAVDVEAANGIYNVTSTLATSIYANDIVKATGFSNAFNNGTFLVQSVTTTELDTDNNASVIDATPNVGYKPNIRVVGHKFASGDLVATVVGGRLVLTSSAYLMTNLGLSVGQWIFIGGDNAAEQFTNGYGYASVLSISNTAITLDRSTGLTIADAGAGKTIKIFFGTYIRNGLDETEIITRTYRVERTLGQDANGEQGQVETGSYANEFALKIPAVDKLSADLSFISLGEYFVDGTETLPSEAVGVNLVLDPGEDAYNTSSDMYVLAMAKVEAIPTLTPTLQFSFVTEMNFNINNGLKLNKAVGRVGGISASLSNFKAGGSVTAYFQTVAAQRALANNDDVSLYAIFARRNAGFVFDAPLLTLDGGLINVSKNEAITVPLNQSAVMNPQGYTFSYTTFDYLPDLAMPVAVSV